MDNSISGRQKIVIAFAYIIMMIPMCFSMYYAVPAIDDFAFGANTVSDNLLINALGYVAWNWKNWSGRWLTFFVQKLTCPLNMHVHLGHRYGIIMIVLFLCFSLLLIYAVKNILMFILNENEHLSTISTLVIIAILYTTRYYSEVYNWYIGATAYALPMMLMLINYVLTLKYFETGDRKHYIGMIAAGIFPAVNEMYDVPIGIFYLYVLLKSSKKNNTKVATVKNLVPICIYVLLGMSNVFAPGTSGRGQYYDVHPSFVKGVAFTIIDIVTRIQDVFVDHPFSIFLFLILLVIGIFSNKDNDKEEGFLFLIIAMAIGVFGCLFPYVYGRAFTTTYVDIRMEYVVEYLFLLSGSVLMLKLGRWISYKFEIEKNNNTKILSGSLLLIFLYVAVIQNYAYLNIVQMDILRSRSLITESYALWDGILAEIENSPEEDVVITREKELNWTPYFLYTGITEGDLFSVPMDTVYDKEWIMPNVYYGKNSIVLNYTEND